MKRNPRRAGKLRIPTRNPFPFLKPVFRIGAILTIGVGIVRGAPPDLAPLLDQYCVDCHDGSLKRGGLDLESMIHGDPAAHPDIWEKVILRLETRQMPPPDEERPDEPDYKASVAALSGYLDGIAAENPDPGRPDTIRRLTRFEYKNAIRDLLGVEIDVTEMLPKDESSQGFDNITLGTLSPALLNRYVQAAQKISALAVGIAPASPAGRIVRLPPDLSQEDQVEGLPPGTRGGALVHHQFPVSGEYEIGVRLTRDRNEDIEGLHENHELLILLGGEQVAELAVKPPPGRSKDFTKVDANLKARIQFPAGSAEIGITFVAKPPALEETKRLPYDAHFNMHRHPRQTPAVYQISITGPYAAGEIAATPGRERIFGGLPDSGDEETRARAIFTRLIRKAFRRPATEDDLVRPLGFFREALAEGNFNAGIEAGLSAILVSPRFLLRVEKDPAGLPAGTAYPLDPFALASRLSFFLWSSLPDEELLDLAESGDLTRPEVLEAQARRLLADPRSSAFVTNFAGQWLRLRNLDSVHPDLRLFPDFDDNLRQSLRRETELFFESVLRENRGVADLLRSDYTFLNGRLAKHYGITGIEGSAFRRVELPPDSARGGLLRQGSVLAVTSYANRTSPVIRGNWILDNILGTPTPPPPPDIPALSDTVISAGLPMRERLAAHRAEKSCSVCHDRMDPVGFALENYDATGRWRDFENEIPVDARGGLPDGSVRIGPGELERGLLERPEVFARTITAKMLTYAIGRIPETGDQPAIRAIVSQAAPGGYRLSDLVIGIVRSVPFTMRKTQP